MRKFVFFVGLLFCTALLSGQEICDNAIDDDGDGLIDLNDVEDCNCETVPSSLIPNPSFEERTCCPQANGQLNCAIDWVQASAATSDYVHSCEGYLGHSGIGAVAPLPFPDGEGGVGFKDGEPGSPNYKEYVGACLTAPMVVGRTYRIDFYVGFRDDVFGSDSFEMAMFGSTSCDNLPFGNGNFTIGCPLNAGGYDLLEQEFVSGNNEWINVVFEFEAQQPYEVIVLGPGCEPHANFNSTPYFYVDRLTLAEESEFEVPYESISGSVCSDNLVLEVADDPQNQYQWYQDGVALIGETSASITLTSTDHTDGEYVVFITSPLGCGISAPYNLSIPPYYASQSVQICEGDVYILGTDTFSQSGYYEPLLVAPDGCDSIIQLDLEVLRHSAATVLDTFCLGDTYSLLDISTMEGGIFETTINNAVGCDSVITLMLHQIDPGFGVILPDEYTITLGEQLSLQPDFLAPWLSNLRWYDSMGVELGSGGSVPFYRPVTTTQVFLQGENDFGCTVVDSSLVRVGADYELYIPNAFSPNNDGVNDYFRCYHSLSLAEIRSIEVYDRWGGLVFREENIKDLATYRGWDGKIEGEPAQIGVYVYQLQARFLDDTELIFSGDVNLLR